MMLLVLCLKLLIVVVIKRSSHRSINPFFVIGHIEGKQYIYVMHKNICGDTLRYLTWNSEKITLFYKCFSLIFLVHDQGSGFHEWGISQRIEKASIEKGNTYLVQQYWLGPSVVTARANTSWERGAAWQIKES